MKIEKIGIVALVIAIGPDIAFGLSYPTGWVPNPNNTDAQFFWDQSFGRTDTFSVRITASERFVTLANPGWKTEDFIPIDPQETYLTSVYTYTPDGGVGHRPAIQFFNASGGFLGTIGAVRPSGFTDPIGTWLWKSFTFTPSDVPAFVNAAMVRMIVVQDIDRTQGSLTTVYFDDAFLGALSGGSNLLANPSFVPIPPAVWLFGSALGLLGWMPRSGS